MNLVFAVFKKKPWSLAPPGLARQWGRRRRWSWRRKSSSWWSVKQLALETCQSKILYRKQGLTEFQPITDTMISIRAWITAWQMLDKQIFCFEKNLVSPPFKLTPNTWHLAIFMMKYIYGACFENWKCTFWLLHLKWKSLKNVLSLTHNSNHSHTTTTTTVTT